MTFIALPDPLRVIVEARVAELLSYRRWYKQHTFVLLRDVKAAHRAELHALIRLLRAARLQEKADTVWHAPEQLDEVTAAKGYHDWQSGR